MPFLKTMTSAVLLLLSGALYAQEDVFNGKEISFLSLDSLEITADLYEAKEFNGTYIILFHQANFSRGSYRVIAPRLTELGYHCLAVDQRSGHKARQVINKTCKRAIAANKKVKFKNAVQDMEAALLFAKNELKAEEILIWGSSYSASGVLYLGSKFKNDVSAILSFSPGEYYKINDRTFASYAGEIGCPVFFSSARSEKKDWERMYEQVKAEKSYYLPTEKGFHGSKALWPEKEGNKACWEAVISFLTSLE